MTESAERRKRRTRLWLIAIAGLALAMGAGVANAAQIHVDSPPSLMGTPRSADPNLNALAARYASDYAKHLPKSAPTGAFYEGFGRDTVLFYGETAPVAQPARQLDDALSFYGPVGGIQAVPAGPLGGVAKCGAGTLGGNPATVCGWADKGSVGVLVWPNKPTWTGAIALAQARSELEHVN